MGRFDFRTRTGQISAIIQGSFDADALAFFNRVTAAGGSLTSTEQLAINDLVLNMKNVGIWNNMKAIYPMVGASAAACAQNLKSSSFTGTFTSGWTFGSTGVTPNGISAFMNSDLNPSTSLLVNNTHLSYYSRTSTIVNGERDIAVFVTGSNPCMSLGTNTGVQLSDAYHSTTNRISSSISNALGFVINSRVTSNSHKLYKNGAQLGATDTTANIILLPSQSIYLGGANLTPNAPAAGAFSNKQCAFASIGDGLTDNQASNFYTAVQSFQTSLSRQV